MHFLNAPLRKEDWLNTLNYIISRNRKPTSFVFLFAFRCWKLEVFLKFLIAKPVILIPVCKYACSDVTLPCSEEILCYSHFNSQIILCSSDQRSPWDEAKHNPENRNSSSCCAWNRLVNLCPEKVWVLCARCSWSFWGLDLWGGLSKMSAFLACGRTIWNNHSEHWELKWARICVSLKLLGNSSFALQRQWPFLYCPKVNPSDLKSIVLGHSATR